jgi:hypothetical protein
MVNLSAQDAARMNLLAKLVTHHLLDMLARDLSELSPMR